MGSRIRHPAAAPWDDDLVVIGAWERAVEVWSSFRGVRVAAFDTVLDAGGTRLTLASGPVPVVVAGAWARHGVCAYGLDGRRAWQNRSRTNVQQLTVLSGRRVAVGYASQPTVVLDATTGRELTSLRGVTTVVALDPRTTLLAGTGWLRLADADLTPSWRRTPAVGFSVSHAAGGPETVAVVEAEESGSVLRVFDRDGAARASVAWPDEGIGPVSHDAASGTWVVLRVGYEGRRHTLVRLTDDGEVVDQRPWHPVDTAAVMRDGRVLVYANDDGVHVLDVADLSVRRLAPV
ncbi:hypothetical protein JOD57_003248 [Geodermatophilus bullaregiensis]|uniref:hypothetical protein n=1 Tax=Geodermatophilus bullaregiensis TaxID=1564160 RepID=UPI0019594B47|nr:hypothetical protein [Geodermatophilus bullaregiensis]MBM7807411.1 hypothetical protein [Geodermatophilus bullaregiensis]